MRLRLTHTPARCTFPVAIMALLAMTRPLCAETARVATEVLVQPASAEQPAEVRVRFSAPPEFTARYERESRRIVVDVADSRIEGAAPVLNVKSGEIAGVLTQTYKTGKDEMVRVWVTLRSDTAYTVTARGNDLVVTVREKGQASGSAKAPASPRAASNQPSELVGIEGVKFEHQPLVDQVRIALPESLEYRESQVSPKTARLTISGATLSVAQSRILDVSAVGKHVTRIASFADPKEPGRVLVEVDTAEGVEHRVAREGSSLLWEFYRADSLPSSMTGVGRDGGVARRTRTVSSEVEAVAVPQVEGAPVIVEHSTSPEAAEAVGPAFFAQQKTERFGGRRIDLDLKDADIHNVLRLLADVGRVNVVTADNVQGSVTIRMRNVPWDQALDVILQAKSLGMVRQANMIRVAPLSDLEKERDLAIARAKQEVQLAPVETRIIPVSYAAAKDIQQRARDLLSERGSIAVDERTNVMIVRDVAGNLNQVEELTRALDTQTPQVLVEARIVEATSRYLRDVGIQWGGDATFSAATGNPTGLAFPNAVGVVGGASDGDTPTAGLSSTASRVENPNFAVNLPAAVGTGVGGAIGLTFGSIDNTINLAVRLSAAESTGMVRILSSPRVLTLDNREARIAQGTLIPFSQVSAQGVQTTFQEAKLQLLVRPHVTSDGSVSMQVKINRDEPDFNQTSARGDPTILKREAETEMLVMDGHTAVIGGIYTRNTGRNLDQVPFFGDIPIIGLLFQHRKSSDTRGELIIFLTPRIVNRAESLGR
jgi:type IV pilus assembly protein PilQ